VVSTSVGKVFDLFNNHQLQVFLIKKSKSKNLRVWKFDAKNQNQRSIGSGYLKNQNQRTFYSGYLKNIKESSGFRKKPVVF
jgi:hypothetical protein